MPNKPVTIIDRVGRPLVDLRGHMKPLATCTVLIILLGFAVYANSLSGEFIWDDAALVKDNNYIRSWQNIPKIFTKDWGAGAGTSYTFYRPLTTLTYLFDYSLCKLNVRCYHLSNIFFHIMCGLSIYWLVTILFGDKVLSLLTGLFFTLHPVHTEAVAYISGRPDSLAMLFMLLSFIFYANPAPMHRGGVKFIRVEKVILYSFSLSFFILSILSKENTLVLPLLLLLYHAAFKKRARIKHVLPFFLVILFYIMVRLFVLKIPSPAYTFISVFQRIPGFFAAITNYFGILIFPLNLHMEYGDRLFPITDGKAVFGFCLTIILLAYALRKRKEDSLVFFAVFWFFMTLLPVSNLYPLAFYMAEHYLYVPSLGFFLILSKYICSAYRIERLKTLALFAAIGILSFYSFLTIAQNRYWRNPLDLYERALQFSPDSWRVHHNLALAEKTLGKNKEALESYKKAIISNPDFMGAYNNLALLYSDMGEPTRALALLNRAIKRTPDYAAFYNSEALIYENLGQKEKAKALYEKAIKLLPAYAKSYVNLGNLCHNMGKSDEAIEYYEKAIIINPDYVEALNNLAAEYASIRRYDEAIEILKRSLKLNPDDADTHNDLSVFYYYTGRYSFAIKHADKALLLGGDIHKDYLNLLKPYRK